MTKPKSTIALDDFEHRKAMQQLAAMSQRNNIARPEQALAKIQSWKDSPPPKPEPSKRLKLKPPSLRTKRVVCSVKTGQAFKEYREGLSIKPSEVYDLIGMTKVQLYDLERGHGAWTPKIREKICNAIYDIMAERADREEVSKSLTAVPQ